MDRGDEPEACDCEDNDCDGMTDEPPPGGSLCPPGSECLQCQCASECVRSEFGFQCPTGRVPLVDGDTCLCVEEACDEDERKVAIEWLEYFEGAGLDGVIAKGAGLAYQPGSRAML